MDLNSTLKVFGLIVYSTPFIFTGCCSFVIKLWTMCPTLQKNSFSNYLYSINISKSKSKLILRRFIIRILNFSLEKTSVRNFRTSANFENNRQCYEYIYLFEKEKKIFQSLSLTGFWNEACSRYLWDTWRQIVLFLFA